MTKLKVFAISGASNAKWIDNHQIVDNIDDCDAVLFPGGSDWNPKLYDEVEGKYTSSYSEVDIHQLKYFIEAYYKNKFLIGICRGAQMLGIANGGKLIQHVTKHMGEDHYINVLGSKELYKTNTIHHQMVNWYTMAQTAECKNILLGWADSISTTYLNGNNNETVIRDVNNDVVALKNMLYREPEIFYLGLIKGFGIQGHPEWNMPANTLKFINKYLHLLVSKRKNDINLNNALINSRIYRMIEVYPELRSTYDKYKTYNSNNIVVTKPAIELPFTQESTPKTEVNNETNRNSNNQARVWSDESASSIQ